MAHNLARWTARTGLGEQVVTTKTLRRRFFSPRRTNHPLGPPPHPASSPALALGNPIQSRPGPTASHSTPDLTAPSATELPTAQPNVPANSRHPGPRAVPSVSSVLILPPGPIVDRHRRPQERLQAARRPPAYPNQARIIAPVTPSHPSAVLTPSTCMNRWDSGLREGQGFGRGGVQGEGCGVGRGTATTEMAEKVTLPSCAGANSMRILTCSST